jgi:hypothetical protein
MADQLPSPLQRHVSLTLISVSIASCVTRLYDGIHSEEDSHGSLEGSESSENDDKRSKVAVPVHGLRLLFWEIPARMWLYSTNKIVRE